ncbi:MAG TPA: BMP family ABC transporter substrate-binding protein [Candidatus Limnocylindrales bacterium]|jgi:basic membrane protein A
MTGKVRTVLGLLATAALVAGCSSSGATTAPSAGSALKIGVVTDVGKVDDKNFNQYSYEGAQKAAADLGATVQYVVPKDPSDYAKDIQGFVDQKFNVIVTVGYNLGTDTIKAAKANPDVWFIAVDVAPCVDATGAPDSTFACKGDASTLLPKLIGITFQEDQAGYLAGIVAAAVSKTGKIGQLGGINNNPAVVRYLQGFELGAKSYKSSVTVETAFFSTGDTAKAYADPVWGKTFSTQFIDQKGVDVVFQVAGGTGNGALDAACEKNILAIGVDVDQYNSYPSADKCIVTSAEKHLSSAVNQTIKAIAGNTAKGGVSTFNAKNDGVGYSPFHNTSVTIPADVQGKLDAAVTGMKDGSLKTCPDKCGTWAP